jgi:hypothetical protein
LVVGAQGINGGSQVKISPKKQKCKKKPRQGRKPMRCKKKRKR